MRRLFPVVVIGSALLYAALLFLSVRTENETNDEPAHIIAGYSYWVKRDFRLNPEHPPLSKLLCTIPLLFLKPAFPDDPSAWAEADEFKLGKELLYSSPDGGHRILLACRSVTILFTGAFAVFLAFWTRRNVSTKAALVVFFLFLLDPNMAAHGRYVTTDIFVTAFFFFTPVCWFTWLRTRQNRDLWLTGVVLGLALASKFSAVLLFPILAVIWAVIWMLRRERRERIPFARTFAALILIPAAMLFLLYAGDTRSTAQDPLIANRFDAQSKTSSAWQRVPVPGYYWFRGLQLVARHQLGGHATPAYLLGTLSTKGFVAYFPVAFLVKTPTGTLLLLAAGLLFLRRSRASSDLLLALGIPIAMYMCVAIFSSIDIGIRHILLIYPFLYVLLATLLESVPLPRAVQLALGLALLVNLAEFVQVYPYPLAFFNTLAGGPKAGPRYLLDSNLDWGQGLIDLREELALKPHTCLALEYFGRADTNYYFPDHRPVPGTLEEAKRQPCLIAISVQRLYGDPAQQFSYLRAYEPIARPGYAIYLYDPSRF